MAVLVGVAAWVLYFRSGLVLSHYDAKAHLVVARRVVDNLTPGWKQIGAVWLPLPHVLLLLPVQSDLLYRTGLAGSLLSLACLGVTSFCVASLVGRFTSSRAAAVTAVVLILANPNLLYLHTTPMTEPLLLAVTSLVVLCLVRWLDTDEPAIPTTLATAVVAAAWTRYEAWLVLASAGIVALGVLVRRREALASIRRRAVGFAGCALAAAGLFLCLSRITVGRWFVSDGFFVPDSRYAGQLGLVLTAVVEGTRDLSGWTVVVAAGAAVAAVVASLATRSEDRDTILVALAPFGAAILPLAAFYQGHPFRIRYMTPLVASCAIWVGLGVGRLPRRVRWLAATLLVVGSVAESPPWDQSAAMIQEAQLDRPAGIRRAAVTDCLVRGYRGDKVLMSMGSLAHYMQELSWSGFSIRDFVHEGNGVIWEAALESGPAPHVGWMLVEEEAEGGDLLAERLRRDPGFLAGMTSHCAAGGVRLYRRIRPIVRNEAQE